MRMEYIEHVTDIDQSQGRIEKWRHELPSAPGTEFNVRACGCGMGLQARGDRNLFTRG